MLHKAVSATPRTCPDKTEGGQFRLGCGALSSPAPSFDSIPYTALRRLTARAAEGATKYKDSDQWREGIGDVAYAIERANHVIDHAFKLIGKLKGQVPDDGDDDAAAIMWGGMVLCESTEAMKTAA
jgi:hypothetical protein